MYYGVNLASSPLRGSPDTVREREGRAGEGVNIAIKKALEVRAYLRSNAASLKVAGRNQTRSSNGISAATRGGGGAMEQSRVIPLCWERRMGNRSPNNHFIAEDQKFAFPP